MSKETQKQAREYLINYLKKLEITNMTNFKILPQLLTDFAIQENKEHKDKIAHLTKDLEWRESNYKCSLNGKKSQIQTLKSENKEIKQEVTRLNDIINSPCPDCGCG